MRVTHISTLALTLAIAGCGGGGGAVALSPLSSAPTAAPTGAPLTAGSATFPLSISIPRGAVPSGSARSPRYVSLGMRALALYDGTTLVYVGNFNQGGSPQFTTVFAKSGPPSATAGTCVAGSGTSTCTLTVTSTIGAHSFDIITYPSAQGVILTSSQRAVLDTGTPPAFTGVIVSEGELTVTLSPGTNAAQTLTLLGVASRVQFTGPAVANVNQTVTLHYQFMDSAAFQIIQPGNYDNGPVTITASPSGIVTMTPISQTAPPAATGDQTFNVTCINENGGTATFTVGTGTAPNTSYASGLTYSSANYSGPTLVAGTLKCSAG